MKRLFFKIVLFVVLLNAGLTGCVSLKHVSGFSSESLESVRKFETIDYGFRQNCLENCNNRKILDLIISSRDCDCKADEKADSVTLIIYHAIKGYLTGLTNLTNNNLTNYKLDPLSGSLSGSELGSIRFEKSQVEAYSAISKILLRAFTDKYRSHKIKEYVKAGNGPLKVLIGFLDFNLAENLTGKLNVQKELLKDTYFDLTKDPTLSTFEKRKAVEAYYQQIGNIDRQQKELITYSKSLKKIAFGHQELADNIDKLSKKEIKEQLTQCASDIQDLISAFNKIK